MRLATLAVIACLAAPALAQESRILRPIERPQGRALLPSGAMRIAPAAPITRERIEAAVRQIAAAWTLRELDAVLSPRFYDRQRLLDTVQARVPRDAKLRIVAVQAWQVTDQYRLGPSVVSMVSVTVRTQLEFNDPVAGYQVRDGTNDFLISLTERR